MRALVYKGPREVETAEVPDARITSTNICGSDLHIYEGRAPLEDGVAIGHENLGEVIEQHFDERDDGWTKVVLHLKRTRVVSRGRRLCSADRRPKYG